ncbi:DUF2188 domain-containing protein [Nitratireductor luteus]|uniref:DUF2188 domain-containing protein n=1 Tax=Nitratireductor luteus TaxID=2976980 RepID=UPI0022408A6C|nr:DUF2188 domain-containing protein [Nitratireductor luteus]
MPDTKNYWTQQRPDGKWESKREGAARASKVTTTQADAWSHLGRRRQKRKAKPS